MYYSTTYLSPLGKITLACDACGKNLVGLWLEGQKYYQGTLKEALIERDAVPLFDIAKKWLDRYFSGQKPDVAELPLAPQGNAFRQGVWEILCTIPYGEVITYGSIAKKMAVKLQKERMSSQAVGGAVGKIHDALVRGIVVGQLAGNAAESDVVHAVHAQQPLGGLAAGKSAAAGHAAVRRVRALHLAACDHRKHHAREQGENKYKIIGKIHIDSFLIGLTDARCARNTSRKRRFS